MAATARPVAVVPTQQNQVKVHSISLFRAKMLDRLVGRPIQVTSDGVVTYVPLDIDDLQASDSQVLANATATTSPRESAQKIRDASRADPLNWQLVGNLDYLKKIRTFRRGAKTLYTREISKLLQAVNDPAQFTREVMWVDLTPYATVQMIGRDLEFGNRCVVNVSLVKLHESKNTDQIFSSVDQVTGSNLEAVPRENDVIEVIVEYPDGRKDRWFLGLVSTIEYQEQAREITAIVATCYGLSKVLMVNRLVTDRAVIDQFEDGATPQNGASVIAGGSFAEKTVDQIFTSLMISQMASRPNIDTLHGSRRTLLMTEATVAQETVSLLEARIRELFLSISDNAQVLVDKEFEADKEAVRSQVSKDDDIGFRNVEEIKATIASSEPVKTRLPRLLNDMQQKSVAEAERADATNLLLSQLAREQLFKRVGMLVQEGGLIDQAWKSENTAEARQAIQIDFTFDSLTFADANQFQFVYVPLLTMMAVRSRKFMPADQNFDLVTDKSGNPVGSAIARFSGRRARAFDLLVRGGMQDFFSQISTPNEVLDTVRSKAKFVVYENELNQVVCEIPRYNDFGADPGELVEDFIISNPSNLNISRNDVNLMARQDVRGYQPLIDPSDVSVGRFTMGQFTDPSVLLRYGMRVDNPVYNPNVQSLNKVTSPGIFAAIELAMRNADTRTISFDVPADRAYRMGRMYFVARESLEQMAGTRTSSGPVPINGYVGYLSTYETNVVHGNPTTHRLTLRYARKARLLPVTQSGRIVNFVANFRILPDISGLMDALEEELKRNPDALQPQSQLKVPTGTAEILQDTDTQERVYAAMLRLARDKNRAYLSLNFLKHPSETFWTIPIFGRPVVTTSPRATHFRSLPPAAPTPSATGSSDRIGVLKVANTGEGLQRDLVNNLGLLDLRVRALDRVLFCTRGNNSGDEVVSKQGIFRAIYVPDEGINPYYRIVGLKDLKMSVFNLNDSTKHVMNQVVSTSNVDSLRDRGILIDDYSVLSETPFRLDSAQPHFAILLVHARTISGVPNANTFLVSLDMVKNQSWVNYMAGLAATATSGAISFAQVTAAVNSLPDTIPGHTDADLVLVPVIFHTPYNAQQFVNVVDPGVPLSVFDAAYDGTIDGQPLTISTFRFPSVVAIEPGSEQVGESQRKHAEGNAIDLTLFPWMAYTGLILVQHDPYVLTSKYNATAENGQPIEHASLYQGLLQKPVLVAVVPTAPTPAASPVGFQIQTGNIGTQSSPVTTETPLTLQQLRTFTLRTDRKDSASERSVATKYFQDLLDKTGSLLRLTDLSDNDRVFWHLEV